MSVFPTPAEAQLTAGLTGAVAASCRQPSQEADADADLARIMAAWPELPPHIRAAVLALIGTAGK